MRNMDDKRALLDGEMKIVGFVRVMDAEGLGFKGLGLFWEEICVAIGVEGFAVRSRLWWIGGEVLWLGVVVDFCTMQRSYVLLRGFGAASSSLLTRVCVDNAVKGALRGGGVADAGRSLSTSVVADEKIVAAVVVERLPVVLPGVAPAVEAFESFSFDWRQQFRREYPREFLDASSSREADEGEGEFEPAPTVTEADKTNDRRSLERALNRRLYLLIRGIPYGGAKDSPVWHFPEKEYAKEDSLRLCAEEVIKPFVSNPADVYFVGNAPCGHLHYRLSEPNYKRFFFKSQLIAGKVHVKGKKIKDYAWVSKEELPEYLDPSDLEYMKKMLID